MPTGPFLIGGVGCCTCGEVLPGDCTYTCESCAIPLADMPVSWVGYGNLPGGSATLYVTGVGTWSTGNLSYDNGAIVLGSVVKYLRIDMLCYAGVVSLDITYVDGTGADIVTYSTGAGTATRTAFTCSPFGITGNYCGSCIGVNRFETATVDGSGISGGCCQIINVVGCNSLPVQGATVNVRASSGGTILATGTTDGSGNVSLVWTGSCSTSVYIEAIYSPQFTTAGGTYTVTAGDTTTITLSAATGYHCITGCAVPAPDTLHATHPTMGAITFTYSGGNWIASVSYSYPGFGACPAKTVTVTCTWNGSSSYTESWKVSGTCPDDAGGSTVTATWTSGALACPPGLSKTFGITPSAGAQSNFYQGTGARSISLLP